MSLHELRDALKQAVVIDKETSYAEVVEAAAKSGAHVHRVQLCRFANGVSQRPETLGLVEAALRAWLPTRKPSMKALEAALRDERARVNKPRPVREEYRSFADRVVIALERVGMTRRQLAERASVSVGQVCRYATARAEPGLDVALRLADALGVELLWLASGRGPMRACDGNDDRAERGEGTEMTNENQQSTILIATSGGQCIAFPADQARLLKRGAGGVKAIDVADGDRVVAVMSVDRAHVLTITAGGMGKRTEAGEFRVQNRGAKGVILIDVAVAGAVAGAIAVDEGDEVVVVTEQGQVSRLLASEIRVTGRNSQGVKLMGLAEGDRVVGVARVAKAQEAVTP